MLYTTHSVRRILAITLLIAFGFPLVAPVFAATADPEASLPPCCRSHGKHHCAMMHMMLLAAMSHPAFQAPPCPFYPSTATAPRLVTATIAAALPPSVEIRRDPAPSGASPRRAACTSAPSANLKRGPPSHSA
jgi:hypothetical protein